MVAIMVEDSQNQARPPTPEEVEARYGPIRRESFELLRKAYEERRASVESLNTRSGIALALVGSAVTAANLEVWRFHRPPYSEDWPLWLIYDLANIVSLFIFALGAISILRGLYAYPRHTPYNTYSLNNLGKGTDEEEAYKDMGQFLRLQMSKTYRAHEELKCLTETKARRFNCGLTLVFIALAIAVLGRLVR